MPAPLSVDLRQRVIAAYQAKEGSQRQLAERFKVSLSFVRDLRRHYRETGTVEPKPHGGGAVAKLGAVQLPIVEALIDAQPDALLEELCERFAQNSGIQVSPSTMQRATHRLGLSVKKNIDRGRAADATGQGLAFRSSTLEFYGRPAKFGVY
jgi:transposase